ncbi:MAG: filamentous hemagglutinin N-terminal domain-containing protein, partial [Candidatus Omnitrophica bacterium]|nr:filamentous hemagglutinin N-terminal domain-containing protein [Candidatus Omnitrophota bacterium]
MANRQGSSYQFAHVFSLIIPCIIFSALFFLPITFVIALPNGEQVEDGSATFERPNDSTLNITTSDKVVIRWNNFDIASHEMVNFIQPFSSSVALNRVMSGEMTTIAGALNANGGVIVVNPAGISISESARINVGSLIASALNISNEDFMNGNYNFIKSENLPAGLIINHGQISVSAEGLAGLFGGAVANDGKIVAQKGSIVMACGERITVTFASRGLMSLVSVVIPEGVKLAGPAGAEAGVFNSGELSAAGGKVILTGKQVNDIFDLLVNQSGVIKANSYVEHTDGTIELIAINGTLRHSGVTMANGTEFNADAGTIIIQGKDVELSGTVTAEAQPGGGHGAIDITADNNVHIAGDLHTAARTVAVKAGHQFIQDVGTQFDQTAGDMTIHAGGDVHMAHVVAAGDMQVTSDTGSILESAPGGSQLLASRLTLAAASAGEGIGSTVNPLNTEADSLLLHAGSGGSYIHELSNLVLQSLEMEQDSSLFLMANGSLTLSGPLITFGTGVIDLTANADATGSGDLTQNPGADMHSSGAPIRLTIGNGVTGAGSMHLGKVSAGTGEIILTVSEGSILGTADQEPLLIAGSIDIRGPPASSANTLGTISVQGDLNLYGKWIADNNAILTLSGSWTNHGQFNPVTSTLILTDASKTSTIYGDNTFYNFTSTTPDKKIYFEAGRTQTVLGGVMIEGVPGHLIELRSTDMGGERWRLDSRGTVSVRYVFLGDAWNLSSTEIKALPSNSYGNNIGWDTDPVWDGGGVTENWSDAANWDTNVAPISTDTVTFNATSVKNSTVDSGWIPGTVANLTITTGYTGVITLARSLTVNTAYSQSTGTFNSDGQTLDINGSFTLTGGSFTAPITNFFLAGNMTVSGSGSFLHGSGTMIFDGTTGTIDVPAGTSFNHVTFNNTSTKSITNSFNVLGDLNKQNSGSVQAAGSADPTITLSGNFVMSGTGSFGSNSTTSDMFLTFTGGINHNLTISAGSGTFSAKVIIGAGETMTLLSNLTSSYSQTGAGNDAVNITGGTLETNNFILVLNGNYNQTAGTFNGGSGAHDFNGTWSLSGTGVFNASSGAMTVASTFTVSGGTFNAGTGTVTFDGGVATLTLGGITLNHVIFNSTSTKSLTGNMTIAGNLTVQGTGSVTEVSLATPILTLNGNYSQTSGTFGSANLTLKFGGSISHTLSVTAGTFQPKWVIDSATETVVIASPTVTIGSPGTLTMSAGQLDVNTRTLTLNNTFTLSGGSVTVNAVGGGQLQVASTFTQSGGSIDNVNFSGTSTVTLTQTAGQLGNVTFSNTSGTKTLAVSGNEFTITGNVLKTGAGTVSSSAAVILRLSGNFSMSSGIWGNTNLTLKVTPAVHTYDQTGGTFDGKLLLDAAGQAINLNTNFTGGTNATITISDGLLDTGTSAVILNNSYSQTGGTFNGGSGAHDFNSTWSLSGTGIFNTGSGIITLASTFTVSGGTFNAGTGTVTFDGGAATLTMGGITLNHVIFNSTSTKSLAGNFSTTGDITKLGIGTVTQSTGTPIITLGGSFSLVAGTFGSSSITLEMTGAAAHSFSFTTGAVFAVNSWHLDAAEDVVNLAANFTQNSGTLNINGGTFNTAGFVLTHNGNYNQTAGTFNGGSGAHDFNGTWSLSGTGVFNASSGAMTVASTFTVSGGTFNAGTGTVT